MRNSFTLSEAGVRNINRTIQSVNRMKVSGPQGDLPFRQNPKRQPSGATLKIGKTTAAWTKGEEAEIDVWKRNADGDMEKGTGTFTAYNLFADVAADKFVGCMSGFLVSAECD